MSNKIVKVTWTQIHKLTRKLSTDIKKQHTIDSIVAIARGGLVPARYFSKFLGIRRIYTLGIEFYSDVQKSFRVPHVYQGLTHVFDDNECVLLVDDIVDSGESMGVAMGEIVKNNTKNIVSCSLHYKSKSTYRPNFYGERVPNNVWLKYDWEK